MSKRILVIQGHPDERTAHFCHALATAYREGAQVTGHKVREIRVARLRFPLLASARDWEKGAPPAAIRRAQRDIAWADHLVIVFPLWLGSMPALLKAFLEQALRPGFALRLSGRGGRRQLLKGKSARIVVTMGMPAFLYRWYFRSAGVSSLERGILALVGVRPIAVTLIGRIAGSAARRRRWLKTLWAHGERGD